ncbi:hypothetical protein [Gilvimarinus sp. DA14]|uniref:hypothetical protein n=1 Tax=Gilvimarinus sp. DA14 TaxID=2956798 RepID=UPI0020B8EE53|nr:hypothetical protein [Gilvimarinus sp. DA14]UTF59165.1 hypothetical protein NHM04_11835 [Gilvimarinus sp. DA14]
MKRLGKVFSAAFLLTALACLGGCDPQVYGNIGIQSGWGSGPHLTGSISVGGRIH